VCHFKTNDLGVPGQSFKHLTLGFGSGHDLRVVGSSLASGSVLSGERVGWSGEFA